MDAKEPVVEGDMFPVRRPGIVAGTAVVFMLVALISLLMLAMAIRTKLRGVDHGSRSPSMSLFVQEVLVILIPLVSALGLLRRRTWSRLISIGVLLVLSSILFKWGARASLQRTPLALIIGYYAVSFVFGCFAFALWKSRRAKRYFAMDHQTDVSSLD